MIIYPGNDEFFEYLFLAINNCMTMLDVNGFWLVEEGKGWGKAESRKQKWPVWQHPAGTVMRQGLVGSGKASPFAKASEDKEKWKMVIGSRFSVFSCRLPITDH